MELLDALGLAVIATDPAGIIRFWNPAAEKLYGWSSAEAVGRDVTTVTPAEIAEADAREIMEHLSRGESWSGVFPLRRKDGRTFLAHVTDTPVLDDQGRLAAIVGVSRDVTAPIRGEERTRFLAEAGRVLAAPLEMEELLDKLARLPIPILADFCLVYRVDEDGAPHRVARAHLHPRGQALLDRIERDFPLNLDSDRAGARVLRELQPLFLPDMSSGSWRGSVPDEAYERIGSELAPNSGIFLPLVARGRALGALALVTSETQAGGSGRRYTDEDLQTAKSFADLAALVLDNVLLLREARAARAAADEANRAKSAFLASMSHELRTPLNAIAGYVELIDMGIRGPVTDQQHEDLARIQRSQQHLLGLINDVLNFVKLDAGQVRYDMRDVPLGATLQRVEELVLPQIRAKGLQYDRPVCDPDLHVHADAEKLRQIFVNLLTNATKFTESGGRIEVTHEVDGDAVLVHVRDTGRGIPMERLEVIFEPFVQLPRLDRPTDGVGLGLAISRDLARHMGGDITAESEAGRGATFTVRLPLAAGLRGD